MFQATFSFSTQHGVAGLQVEAVSSDSANAPAVEMTFRIKDYVSASFKEVRVGRLVGYTTWSEAPLTLLLRCMHWLRVEGFSSIPPNLISHPVRDMSLTVSHLTRASQKGPALASLALEKVGYGDDYTLTQSLPNRARFPMKIDTWSAVPLGAAAKAVAQVLTEPVDLHAFPVPNPMAAVTDAHGQRHVLREQIPYFAKPAFDAYKPNSTDLPQSLVPAAAWADFLAA
jgi:hypothetical protein